jgi:hypothetical protein
MTECTVTATVMDTTISCVRHATLIDTLEQAATEALQNVRRYRLIGNLTVANVYADLAESRAAHLKRLLLEQAALSQSPATVTIPVAAA